MRKLRFAAAFVVAALLPSFADNGSLSGIAPAEAAPIASDASAAAALISRYRAQYGLGPVRIDARLNAAAAHQAKAVAQGGWLSHGDFAGAHGGLRHPRQGGREPQRRHRLGRGRDRAVAGLVRAQRQHADAGLQPHRHRSR
jgi:hypothetical protein